MRADTPVGTCHPVEEARWYMQRFHFLERRSMEILAAWMWTTGDLDAKMLVDLHSYEDTLHADLFVQRTKELHTGGDCLEDAMRTLPDMSARTPAMV